MKMLPKNKGRYLDALYKRRQVMKQVQHRIFCRLDKVVVFDYEALVFSIPFNYLSEFKKLRTRYPQLAVKAVYQIFIVAVTSILTYRNRQTTVKNISLILFCEF